MTKASARMQLAEADAEPLTPRKVALFANTDWYLYNFRLSLARALRQRGDEVVLISPRGDYCDRFAREGLRWRELPMHRRSLDPTREARVLLDLFRLLRDEGPDLLHCFTIKPVIYGGLAARAAGVKAHVSSVAGLGHVFSSDDLGSRVLRGVLSNLFRLALAGRRRQLVLQNNDDLAYFTNHALVARERACVIPGSGVNTQRFRPGPERRPERPLTVLMACRLLWNKGVRPYVDAARRIGEGGRDIRFLLAGQPDEGNPNAVPQTAIRQWVADGVVEWLGHVDDMAGLMDQVDVCVLPTTYGEGVPRSLLEGAASGKALITTDTPGCRDVVADGRTGLIVPPNDGAALARALVRLDADRALLERLGAAAREHVLNRFDEGVILASTLAVYEAVA
jgi:glycosyltransferase involved in cell wall biosynthesis